MICHEATAEAVDRGAVGVGGAADTSTVSLPGGIRSFSGAPGGVDFPLVTAASIGHGRLTTCSY